MAEKSLIEEDATAVNDLPHNFTFPKAHKLLKRYEYVRLFKHGTRLLGKTICVDYLLSRNPTATKMGITVSTRYGKAHTRNLFKRKVREAFRLIYPQLPQNIFLNVIPRHRAKSAKSVDIQQELKELVLAHNKKAD
mgnify:CR=1 FL=1